MESQGCGVHVVMNAKLALEMGAPIRGIVAFTSTSTYVSRIFHAVDILNLLVIRLQR